MNSTQRDVHQAVYARLYRIKERDEHVSNAEVRAASHLLGVDPRTIRRNLTKTQGEETREAYVPTRDDIAAAAMCEGNLAAAYDFLEKSSRFSRPPVSLRTFQRGFAERFDAVQLAAMRGRYKDHWNSLQAAMPAMRRHFPHRAHTYAMDHTKLPNFVRLPGSDQLIRPWCTDIIDEATGLGLRASIYPHDPTMEQSVETLAAAVEGYTTADGFFIGGVPKFLLSDRGPDLITRAMTLGLVGEGGGRKYTDTKSPRQNGRVERGHGTFKQSYCPRMPGYDMSGWTDDRNPRAPEITIAAGDCLLIGEFAALFARHLDDFNTVPCKTDGKSRLQRWVEDPEPLLRAEAVALRAALTQRLARVLRRGRIEWDGRSYIAPDLSDQGRLDVEIGVLSTRTEWVEVYHNGRWLCRAHDNQYPSQALAEQAEANRKRAEKNFAFLAEEAMRLRREVMEEERAATAAAAVDWVPPSEAAADKDSADEDLEQLAEQMRSRIDHIVAAQLDDDADDNSDDESEDES